MRITYTKPNMKTLSYVLPVLLLLISACQNDSKKTHNSTKGIAGIWSDVNGDDFKNCYATFSIEGDSVYVAHYLEHKDRSFFEKGSGIVKGDSLIYHVDVIKPIPEWGPGGGTHYLKFENNGLKGFYITDSGYKGDLEFTKN